jgi:hypothetical protein
MPSTKTQPALLGGLVLGVLSALPFIGAGNLCCCLWILAGGALAAYLLQEKQRAPISVGDGAAVGLMAGAVGAVVWLVVSVPVGILMGPLQTRMMRRVMEGDLPDGVRQMLQAMGEGGPTLVGLVFSFFLMLVLCLVFSTVGGVIGAAWFKKPGPGPADVGPPPDLPPPLPPPIP